MAGEDVTHHVEMRSHGELQAQLRALAYREPVGADSVPLVRHLLQDVMRATERRDALELELEHAQREAVELSQIILPLRKENAKLLRENNSLHLEMIHEQEALRAQEKHWEMERERLKDELSQARFVQQQQTQTIVDKERNTERLHAQLERVMAGGGGNKSQKPMMEMRGGGLRASASSTAMGASHGVQHQQHTNEEMEQDAHVIAELRAQLDALTAQSAHTKQECQELQDKLHAREREIERLSELTVQRTMQSDSLPVAGTADDETTELQIMQLSSQVDILNAQVAKYEARLKSANEQLRRQTVLERKLTDADAVNEKLQRELNALQSRYRALENETAQMEMENTDPNVSAAGSATQEKHQGLSGENDNDDESGENERDQSVSALKEQLQAVTLQKGKLEDALRAMHYDKVSFTNALSNANSHNRVLNSDLTRSETIAKDATQGYTKAQRELADTRAQLEAQVREAEVLRESVAQAEQGRALEREKNAALHRELRAMDKVVHQREEECRTLNQSLAVHKGEVERTTQRLESLRASVESEQGYGNGGDDGEQLNETEQDQGAGKPTARSKQRAMYAQEMKWLEEERRELRLSKEELMRKVMALEDAAQTNKTELQTLEMERDELKRTLEMTTASEARLQTMVETKKQEYQGLQREQAEWKEHMQRIEEELRQASTRLKRADEVENEKIRFQNEVLALRRRVEEIRDENASLQHSTENSGDYVARLRTQLQELQELVSTAESDKHSAEKERMELQHSYDSAMVELRNTRQLCNHYQREFEKLSNEVTVQQQSRTSDQSALQNSQSYLGEMKLQIRQLQSELLLKTNALHQAESRLEQDRIQHKSVQSQLVLTQDELLQVKERARAVEITLKQVREDLTVSATTQAEKNEGMENLKLLMEQMEASREQLMFKLKQEQQRGQRQQSELDELHSRLLTAERVARERQGEVVSLQKLTRALDAEKDDVHDQLDGLTEKFHELSEKHTKLQEQATLDSNGTRDLQERMAQLVEQLNAAESQYDEDKVTIRQLERELDASRHANAMNDAEMKALAQDLENMTVENQALSEECSRLQYSCQRGDQSTSVLQQRVRDAERDRDIINVELEDVRATYQALIHEHESMKHAQESTARQQDELAESNESLRRKSETAGNELEVLRQKNLTLTTESAAYREQISFLTERLRSAEQQLGEAAHAQQQVRSELEAQQHVAQEISAQRYGAQAQNAAVAQRIVHLEAKLSNTQVEVETLQKRLRAETSQLRSVEDLVVTLRQQIASKDAKIEHLEEQREVMAHEIRRTSHQRYRSAATEASAEAMDMSELNHASPDQQETRKSHEHRSRLNSSHHSHSHGQSQSRSRSRSHSQSQSYSQSYPRVLSRSHARGDANTDSENDVAGDESGASVLPMRALQRAQVKCKELEDRLARQDETIKHMERSRSKFKRFAAKYEREIESRDRLIEELKSSHASSSFVSPERAAARLQRSARSLGSLSSSSSASSHQSESTSRGIAAATALAASSASETAARPRREAVAHA